MLILPDVVQIGPFPLPTFPLLLIAGMYLWYALSARGAAGWHLDRRLVEEMVYRAIIGGLLGAKLVDIARSPLSFLASPRLLAAVPSGTLPQIGFIAGALLGIGYAMRGRWREVPSVLDAVAAPLILSVGVVSLGIGDDRALPMAVGMLLAFVFLMALRRTAGYAGHFALGAVVLMSVVVVLADFVRPGPTVIAGLSSAQLIAGAVGLGAYACARYWGSRTDVGQLPHVAMPGHM